MLKKSSVVSSLGAVLFLSILPTVQAATPATTTTTPTTPGAGSILGTLEGAISFCTKIDAQSVPVYRHMDEILIDGKSSKDIWQVRYSDAYEDAYGQVTKALKALSHNDALTTCKAH